MRDKHIVEVRIARSSDTLQSSNDGQVTMPRFGDEVRLQMKFNVCGKEYYMQADKGRVSKGLYLDEDDGIERFEVTWFRNGAKSTLKKEMWLDYRFVGRSKDFTIGLGDEVQALSGIQLTVNSKEYYREGDKGRVSKNTYITEADDIERFEVTWYRTGLTSTMKKDSWKENFSYIGPPVELDVGDEVQALPGVQLTVGAKEYYVGGDKGKITKPASITQSDSIERFEVTWYRTGLTSTMKTDFWLRNFRVTGIASVELELGQEVQALPGISLNVEGKEYYIAGDKGRKSGEAYIDKNDGVERFHVTWYRTGLTSTMKTEFWMKNFSISGGAIEPTLGLEVAALPGISLSIEGKTYYSPGERGRISRSCYKTDNVEKFEITWYKTGLTSTMKSAFWLKNFCVTSAPVAVLKLGDEVETHPGVELIIDGKDYYKPGDRGRVVEEAYIDKSDGQERLKLTWYRSGLTSTMKTSVWLKNFRFIESEVAKEVGLGDEVQTLPGVELNVDGKEYYKPGDRGRVSKSNYVTQSDGIQRFEITWYRTGLTSTMRSDLWLRHFNVTASPQTLRLGDELEALPGIGLIVDGREYYKAGDRGRLSKEAQFYNTDGIERFEVTWYRTGHTSTMKQDLWLKNYRYVGKSAEIEFGEEIQVLPGVELESDGKVYFKPHDKGRVTKAIYTTADAIDCFDVTWYRSGLTSVVEKQSWLKQFCVIGSFKALELGDEVQVLPGIPSIVTDQQCYASGDKGRVTTNDSEEHFEVTWYRTGLASKMEKKVWMQHLRFTRARKVLKKGDEVEALPGVESMIIEGREHYRAGDKGRITKEPNIDEKAGDACFEVTWYRTGLTSTIKSDDSWARYYRASGNAKDIRFGDEVQCIPGHSLSINGVGYYEAGDKGRVCKTSHVGQEDGIERFEVTWYRTGKTSTMKTALWEKHFILLGRVKQLCIGDEVQALPNVSLNIKGKEYYRQGDTGRVSKNTYIDRNDGIARFEVTWYRTELVSTMKKDKWTQNFRFIGTAKELSDDD